MMAGCCDAIAVRKAVPRRYRVVRTWKGWHVAINGCRTKPLTDRGEAERLAERLQKEADRLSHRFTEPR